MIQATEEKPILKYDNIIVSSRGIIETCGKKVALFVPAEEISRVELKFGKSAHRPILSMVIGIILGTVGVMGLFEFVLANQGYRVELGMIAFGVIGGSVIFDTLKQRYFFGVYKKKGADRLVFSKNAQQTDVQEFCSKMKEVYKFDITETV